MEDLQVNYTYNKHNLKEILIIKYTLENYKMSEKEDTRKDFIFNKPILKRIL